MPLATSRNSVDDTRLRRHSISTLIESCAARFDDTLTIKHLDVAHSIATGRILNKMQHTIGPTNEFLSAVTITLDELVPRASAGAMKQRQPINAP